MFFRRWKVEKITIFPDFYITAYSVYLSVDSAILLPAFLLISQLKIFFESDLLAAIGLQIEFVFVNFKKHLE